MKAVRKAALVWGKVRVPVKIMPLVDTEAYKVPSEIEAHRECSQTVTTKNFCPACQTLLTIEPEFQNLCSECQAQVEAPIEKKWCPNCQKVVTEKELKSVFPVNKNQLMELTERERKIWQATFPNKEEIKVGWVIPKREVNPVYFLTTYTLVPDEKGEYGYGLFKQALSDNELVLIVDAVISKKNYRAIISQENGRLLLITLVNHDEIVWPNIPDVELPPELIETAKDALFKMADRQFRPEEHARNPYREYFQALVAEKIQKRKVAFKPAAIPSPDVLQRITQELMANLRSIQEGKKEEAEKVVGKRGMGK